MEHRFNTEIAKEYGIEEAIIISSLFFWILKNEANDVNEHDGAYWTSCSTDAMEILFPYMSKNTIYRTIQKLVSKGVIKKGSFNTNPFDRKSWYTFTEKGILLLQKNNMHFAKMQNEILQNCNFSSCKNASSIYKDIEKDIEIYSGEADASDTQKAEVNLEGEEEKKEKKVAQKKEKIAPKEKDIAEREQEFRLAASIYNATYGEQLVKEFCDYWTEPTTGGKKLRWEMQKTWDLKRRLATWYSNEQKFYGNRRGTAQQPQQKRPQDMTDEELRKARGEEAFKEYLKRQAEGVMI